MTDFNNRDIYVLGTSDVAKEVITMVEKKVHIHGVVSLQKVKKSELFCGYPIYNYDDIKAKKRHVFFIDCTSYHYDLSFTEERLLFDGYKLDKDFIDYVNFCVEIMQKPVMIVSGFCHTDDIYRGLTQLPLITDEYLVYCFSYDVDNMSKFSSKVLNRLIKKCSVYIYNYNANNILNFEKKDLPPDCKTICVPLVRFYGIWPQINMNHYHYENPYYVKPAGFYDGAFIGGDVEITKRINQGIDWKDIYSEIVSNDFYSPDEVCARFNQAMRQMEYSEMYGDLHITSFIREEFRNRRLFKDYRHLANPIVIEYIQQICSLLKIEISDEYINNHIKADLHEYSEMPVYPSVAKSLGLKWVDENTKYCVRSYNALKYVTFKEYVQWYCTYSNAVKIMKENW